MEFDDNEITVSEMQLLVKKVEEFYIDRGSPRFSLIWLADSILKRLYNDLDYYTNIEGKKGFGKSNMILLLALLQCRYSGIWKNKNSGKLVKVFPRTKPLPPEWEHIKVGFSFDRNMSFFDNTEELKKKYYGLDKYMPFIIDEGSKNLHKYQWSSKLQFLLVQMSDTERYQNKSFYVCFPNFKELNSVFRNDRIEMRIYIFNKNVTKHYSQAIVSLKDVNRHVIDPWHTDDNAKNYEYLLRKVPIATRGPHHILYAESKLKGFAGYFDVPDLSIIAPRIWSIYMKYKIQNAQRDGNSEDTEDLKESKRLREANKTIYSLLLFIKTKYPDITHVQLTDYLKMPKTSVSRIMNKPEHKELEQEIKDRINLINP